MTHLLLERLTKRYGAQTVVDGLELDVARGECIALLGPSGCGKTTTLRMVAGYVSPDAGRIVVDGRAIERAPPHKRNIGMVFQNYALFPHMTAAGNVAFGLEMQGIGRAERDARVTEALAMVGLAAFAARYPAQLSGGQQQRVALARALVIRPALLLLDEPLSNLDAGLRVEMRQEIAALRRRTGITTLFVTHDQEEALALADRIAVMHQGRIVECAPPEELTERPRHVFTAGFLGARTVLPGRFADGLFQAAPGLAIAPPADAPARPTHLVLRAARLRLAADDGTLLAAPGRIAEAAWLGDEIHYEVMLDAGPRIRVLRPTTEPALPPGTAVTLAAGADALTFLDDFGDTP
ncbi:ABC transporter ATP-binding protein [Roseomonas fluvialis]|uniref:Fe3+/spermidine/putrescine ABC transporter ATP-binding protein n=1 Tax=Roseomonas fluvialis TaxID=1750527 RepID=A0ABN6PCX5_9PROT|nr:ABC transporter ATP-binding protein [Roseomonas fluvialis]BDG75188.1 Fe3+/spermidine/putrescine ABC transporter ATP-binding protein [Roseomonas fluvialis]